jgi:hypothetical protein
LESRAGAIVDLNEVEKRKASAFVGNQRPAGRQNLMENVV